MKMLGLLMLHNIKKIKESMFSRDSYGNPHWKALLLELLFRQKLPGRIEGYLFYLRYKVRKWLLPIFEFIRFNEESRTTIFVNLKDAIGDRYLFQLLSFFSYGGYCVEFFTSRPEKYFRRFEYMRIIFTLKDFKISNEFPKNTEDRYLCFDEKNSDVLNKKWRKPILLNQDISLNRNEHKKAIVIPYSMHPVIYKLKHHEKLFKFRNNKKMLRIFFSGMCGLDYYHSKLAEQFKKLSRFQIVEIIINSGLVTIINSRRDIKKLLRGKYKNIFAFVNTKKTVVFQEHWLDTISRSDFFLSPPGDVRPMCHNIIEAMAVGTIPITNYSEWFHPALVDGRNCIVFDSEKELIEKIKTVLEMDSGKIKEMRDEVIKYYESYLSPASFINQIESNIEDKIEVFLNSGNREYLSKVNNDSIIISQE